MMFTDAQLAQLKQIIADHHAAYLINYFGPKTVPEAVLARLREMGLVKPEGNSSENAFLYGKLLQTLNTPQAAQMTLGQVGAYLKQNPMPLTPVEQQAVNIAAARAAQFVSGLGNRIATDTGELIINGDAELRRQMQSTINTEVSQGIAQRKSIQQVKSALGHATGDWTRDLDRIAATETSRAMNQGLAAQLRADRGNNVEVSVLSRKGCCPQCAAAYVGPDGAPIIFRLDDLEANGTNYKKKKADMLPVVPPYHPNCACSLVHIPPKAGYNEANNLVPRGPRGIRPHAQAFKSLVARQDTLRKAHMLPFPALDWWGIRVANATRILSAPGRGESRQVPDVLWGVLKTPTGSHPCMVGPSSMAPQAYVAHNPSGDTVCLGFNSPEAAQFSYGEVNAASAQPLEVPLAYSQVPVHELAAWLGGPKVSHVLPGPLEKAGVPATRKPNPKPDGRLVLPRGPLKKPRSKVVPENMRLYDPKRLVRRDRTKVAKPDRGLLLNPPQKRQKPVAADGLHARGCEDDSMRQDAAVVIRNRVKRMPVTHLRPVP